MFGQTIEEAMGEAADSRQSTAGLRYSFDMLGEGARTERDAQRYLLAYAHAIDAIARSASATGAAEANDGISIKLSALHPRYEHTQHARVMAELVPRVWSLCERAARANINFTIDAEEVERLELSLDVLEALAEKVAAHYPGWKGFGLALQAYQTRALALVREVQRIAAKYGLRLMCRLVKGAYWDSEVKRAQELGLTHYPVFTHKHHTDLCYLACAHAMLQSPELIYPQFATHNAATIAALMQMGARTGAPFELQRLHGMAEGVYREVLKNPLMSCRVYAPVGAHADLLAYLVRRLLENGANSSFVHQLADPEVPMDELLISPLRLAPHATLPMPAELFGPSRRNSAGLDLAVQAHWQPLMEAWATCALPEVPEANIEALNAAVKASLAAGVAWRAAPVQQRGAVLRASADALEAALPSFCAQLVKEAGKTWGDAVSEVREAVDFLRYYAHEAERIMAPQAMPGWHDGRLLGVTGETNELRLVGRGPWVCISPWNFPLAIFAGQVAAALVTGNTVLAKPAEQTPRVALAMVQLMHRAGVPEAVLQLFHGPGETVGAALVAHPSVAGVAFTGSTQVARIIQRALAAKDGPIVPLIAETGGINAMLVDSTALPEQVADAVVQSAFRSAGQRCSALRLLCVHEAVADRVIEMITGAAAELVTGDAHWLSTDVGPVIDDEAAVLIRQHLHRLSATARALLPVQDVGVTAGASRLLVPQAFEVASVDQVRQEIFGPVLQVVRWNGEPQAVIDQINALGYGLTLGLQTRIDSRAQALAARAHVGNVYVNRNMIGAVVGVQPFGGEGLSGTGPKAGGPHYLYRFCAEQTVTVNTTAAGANVQLLG